MTFYETVFILDAPSDAIDAEIQKVTDLITANKGEVVSVDRWGMKKLAYEIKRKGQGFYTCVYFKGEADLPAKLEHHYKLSELYLRYLTVVSIHTAEEIAARAKKTAAETQPSARAVRVSAPAEATAKEAMPVPEAEKPEEAVTAPEAKEAVEATVEAEAAEPAAEKLEQTPPQTKDAGAPPVIPEEKPEETEASEPSKEKPEETPAEVEAPVETATELSEAASAEAETTAAPEEQSEEAPIE
ncbi:30S ribosomal protein S6, partial [bacterium]|nr:30S ribosomal protein S6 [bacterium]